VVLDRRLDWSGGAQYDLANPRRPASMYETVLREATHPDDLALAGRAHPCPPMATAGPATAGTPALGGAVPRTRRRPPVRCIVADSVPPVRRRLAEIGLRVGGPCGFALAGGHAIAADTSPGSTPTRTTRAPRWPAAPLTRQLGHCPNRCTGSVEAGQWEVYTYVLSEADRRQLARFR
jgi:hypothetical protein